MTRALLLVAALALGGCFQTEAVLTVRPDGSATLVETTRAEGVAALTLLDAGMPGSDLADGERLPLGPGVRLVSATDSVAPGSATRRLVYEVSDVGGLVYRFGRGAALDGLSTGALAAAFSPTGGSPRGPSPEWLAETTYGFTHSGGALTVHVPPRAVATADLWRPDLESHTAVSAGSVRLRFTVRTERDAARLVDLRADSLLAALPSAPPYPDADVPDDPDGPVRELDLADYDALRAATEARREAARALSDGAVGGADRPGLFLAPAGPLTLSL